ncbi:M20/M25/M40 family metallo-hydrolase [Tsuneonella troitsensis]|uniref:M20/M25/M40 family metallo-hydrolase n=1 Tax=Tsuneonella troitsensis TaxID=292222 RepID=UPI00070FC945|nr:M20/M25/M40 family metallo-hydrolase [Tsuneonella troitsensis]
MRSRFLALAGLLAAAPLVAADDPSGGVSEARLKADVERLVAFGTRHTLSEQDNPTRGIGAAVDWGAATFRAISADCGNCLEVVLPERMIEGNRIPAPVRLRNAVAIQRGTERPNEVVIIQGHIDSRVSDVMDFTSDAPGANDDASGAALAIEAARVLSKQKFPTTIVYALLSGEEQGLYGGRLMADYAAEQGWTVKAVLNNDIVGNSCGSDGYCDPDHVRVFSEGPRADLSDAVRAAQRRDGGENDSPGRNLSRFVADLAGKREGGLAVRQIWRTDRMGRGGDQIPFLEKGYPAIRFSVAVEDYDHQHQDLRTEGGKVFGDTVDEMDFAYLARVTQLNVATAGSLARAPMSPAPKAEAAVRNDTLIRWNGVQGARTYSIVGRRTDEPYWSRDVGIVSYETPSPALPQTPIEQRVHEFVVPLRGDDWIFGVQACAAGGVCSPVASAVPGGAFVPLPKPEGDKP